VALLEAAARGRVDAVRELLDTAGPVVYGFVHARVGSDDVAQDLTQEVFLEAVRSAASFRGDAALTTWLCTIARRRLARHYEAERRRAVVTSGLFVVGDEVAADEGADVDRRDEVARAMRVLPVLQRQVLILKYLDERSVAEIAAELKRTPVQVQSLLQRARDGLRRAIEAADA
jgi:RNA polymerase sigma-70 factor (ECF subfamily)